MKISTAAPRGCPGAVGMPGFAGVRHGGMVVSAAGSGGGRWCSRPSGFRLGTGMRRRPTLRPTPSTPAAASGVEPLKSVDEAALPHGRVDPTPDPPMVDPEDFTAPAGQLLPINRTTPPSASDIYHCSGCERPECYGPGGCVEFQWRGVSGGYLREILTSKVYKVAHETPAQLAPGMSDALGVRLYLKREDLQDVHSFKIRGAFNRMARLTKDELSRGVICSSAGNHAQGVALAARVLGCDAVVCMPTNSPEIKIAAVQRLGGTVELVGESFYEAAVYAVARGKREGRTFINAYDDPLCIAGQGTAGNEILRQVDDIDYVFVAVGGGGLIAGIAAVIKALRPEVKIIGVEPVGANSMTQSLVRGARITLSKVDAFADGVAIKLPGAEAFRLCRELLDGMVLVDNSAISSAIKDVFNETRSILEPAGAVAVAGAAAFVRYYGIRDATVVAVTSGSNMNFDRLRLVSEMANVGVAETMFAMRMPEERGCLLRLLGTMTPGAGDAAGAAPHGATPTPAAPVNAYLTAVAANDDVNAPLDITEFKYRYSTHHKDGLARVLFGVGIAPRSRAARALETRMADAGMEALDVSDLELAQTHLRHMIAGLAGDVDDEVVFQVMYPERPGMLHKLLRPLSPRWEVTLMHFRKSGNRAATLMLGLQVPAAEKKELQAALDTLHDEFVFEPLAGKAEEVFKLFM